MRKDTRNFYQIFSEFSVTEFPGTRPGIGSVSNTEFFPRSETIPEQILYQKYGIFPHSEKNREQIPSHNTEFFPFQDASQCGIFKITYQFCTNITFRIIINVQS